MKVFLRHCPRKRIYVTMPVKMAAEWFLEWVELIMKLIKILLNKLWLNNGN
jgi:hypothetical protein